MKKDLRLECNCGSKGHFVAFELWDDDFGYMWATVVEADRKMPLFWRIKQAISYVLGFENLNYEEVVLTKIQAEELKKWLEQF
jgi:hypothetical protein